MSEGVDWSGLITALPSLATVLGTVVTAVATVFLWRVTRTLAVETKRMAQASAQPQVVAHIEPNRWAMHHADLTVSNTGNATAFDIRISFDPPLERDEKRKDRPIPLQRISVLKPGQQLGSHLGAFAPLLKKVYRVDVSWRRDPHDSNREVLTYTLDMNDIEGSSRLGAADAMTQVAEQMKRLREDWQWVARGSKNLSVDVFTSADRQARQEELEQWYAEMEAEQEASKEAALRAPEANEEASSNGDTEGQEGDGHVNSTGR